MQQNIIEAITVVVHSSTDGDTEVITQGRRLDRLVGHVRYSENPD